MSGKASGCCPSPMWGKYRGKVIDNLDPLEMHRLLVDVPALAGVELSWALPCVPYAGLQVGFCFLPQIGANVWIEFEGGDPTHPIWTGCFWGPAEKPFVAATPFQKVIQTEGVILVIDDTPEAGGVRMVAGPPAIAVPVTILVDSAGIQIQTAEAVVTISPEQMTATIPPTVASMTEATINLVTEGEAGLTADTTKVTSAVISVQGFVDAVGDVAIAGEVEVTGDVAMTGAVEVTGEMTVTGGTNLLGDAIVAGEANVLGNLSVEGAVEVAGDVAAAAVEVAIP